MKLDPTELRKLLKHSQIPNIFKSSFVSFFWSVCLATSAVYESSLKRDRIPAAATTYPTAAAAPDP